MDSKDIKSFNFSKITIPKINLVFLKTPTTDVLDQSFRMNIVVNSNRDIQILFGIQVLSKEQFNGQPCVLCQVDTLGQFQTNFDIPSSPDFKNVPMFSNMIAALYPFLREKVNSCFQNNELAVILPPINIYRLIAEFEQSPAFLIQDLRQAQVESESTRER